MSGVDVYLESVCCVKWSFLTGFLRIILTI